MSKLSKSYPMEEPKQWLFFMHPWQDRIDPVFAGRLAALAKKIGKKINILSGFRSRQEQEGCYRTSRPGYAAKPGSSWHEYGMAIDAADLWLKAIDKDAATKLQTTLMQFGLFKPLTRGNGCTVLEDWHIQPIETLGLGQEDKAKLFNSYVEGLPMDAKTFQMITGLLPDGKVGPKTIEKMKEVKSLIDGYVKHDEVTVKVGSEEGKGILLDGHSMVPVRFVSEALGAKVDWDPKTKTVTIRKDV